jgi:hypothetical protein
MGRAGALCPPNSDIDLLGYSKGIIHFDTEIPNGALDLSMTEEKLDGTQVAGPPVNEARFGPSERMCPEAGGV